MGNGDDSDLIRGFARLRNKIDAVAPDVLMIFDTHWFTTGYHLVDAGPSYSGVFTSDEMPWYLNGLAYDYQGCPDLAKICQTVAEERGVASLAIDDPKLARHYATLNVVTRLPARERVVTVSNCQNCRTEHYLEMGAVVAEAIRRSGLRVVLLASGALSHKFNQIDWVQTHPRIYHWENVSSPENIARDLEVIEHFRHGRHDLVLDRFDEYRSIPWEGWGGHYLQMIGALGGSACRLTGETLSDYENARGTGNIHCWFDVPAAVGTAP
jgi:aromatic ring-opening dioxygenase catalytic subunit (LigB family)